MLVKNIQNQQAHPHDQVAPIQSAKQQAQHAGQSDKVQHPKQNHPLAKHYIGGQAHGGGSDDQLPQAT